VQGIKYKYPLVSLKRNEKGQAQKGPKWAAENALEKEGVIIGRRKMNGNTSKLDAQQKKGGSI